MWWAGLLLFFTLAAAWALATPYNATYDEHDHVVRAAGVVRGQILVPPSYGKGDGGIVDVPASLVPPNPTCMVVSISPPPASCLGTPPDDSRLVPVHSRAARYNPVYYAVVGWPLLAFPNMTGVLLARLLSAALCAALLATALALLWPLRSNRLLLLALLVAVSPIVTALNGLVNPGGVAIAAAILMWVALLRLLTEEGPDRTRLAAITAGAAAAIVLTRVEGIVLVGAIAVLAWVAVGLRRPERIRWTPGTIAAAATVPAAVALCGTWMLISRVASFGTQGLPPPKPFTERVLTIVEYNFDYWLRGTIGLFGYGTIGLPLWAYWAWTTVAGALLVAGFAYAGRWRLGYTMLAVPVLCFVLGFALDIYMSGSVGYYMQGRYMLPLWVGAFFLAAWAVRDRPEGPPLRRAYGLGVALWCSVNVVALAVALTGYSHGKLARGVVTSAARWTPQVGMVTPYVILLAGLVGAVALTHRYLNVPAPRPASDPQPVPDHVAVGAT